jgi:hypothetical protein
MPAGAGLRCDGEVAFFVAPDGLAGHPRCIRSLPRVGVGGLVDIAGRRVRQISLISSGNTSIGKLHVYAEQQRQRVRGHIVRALRRPARIEQEIRVMLRLQQCLGISRIRLIHGNHVIAVLVPIDLDRAERERLKHAAGGAGIALIL